MGNKNIAIQGKERIFSIDVMRGVAILGIFIVNMLSYPNPYLYVEPTSLIKTATDHWVFSMIDILFQASFYPLFAFLFGYGLMIIKERSEMRDLSFTKIGMKRMSILLILGIIHAFFIWPGDILIVYAILGFLLILILNMNLSAKTLTILSILLYAIPNLLVFLGMFILFHMQILTTDILFDEVQAGAVTSIYQNGSFWEITVQRAIDWYYTNASFLVLFMVFPLLTLGVAFAKSGRLQANEENSRFYKKLVVFTLPIGLLLKITPYISNNYAMTIFQDLFGGPVLMLGYVSLIYLIANSKSLKIILKPFANVGKMSLSNYISQSIICTLLFYSYGFGLYGQVSYTQGTLIVLGIYILQLIVSSLWLKGFRMGPIEWLWRGLTYGQFAKLKREKEIMTYEIDNSTK